MILFVAESISELIGHGFDNFKSTYVKFQSIVAIVPMLRELLIKR